MFDGARHPVIVFEPQGKSSVTTGAPVVLLTSSAVIHGTPSAPCVAAWDASSRELPNVAAIVGGDLVHSWLFRSSPPAPGTPGHPPQHPSVEMHPMTCRYEANATLPSDIWEEPGTTHVDRAASD
jgi:hypothetical protein